MAEIKTVRVKAVLDNPKALRALSVLLNALNEIGEDFSYRKDVRRALRAAKYLSKHIAVVTEDGD